MREGWAGGRRGNGKRSCTYACVSLSVFARKAASKSTHARTLGCARALTHTHGCTRTDAHAHAHAHARMHARARARTHAHAARTHCSKQKQVYERVTAIGARLSKKPESVEEYVSLMSFLEEELEKQQELMVPAHQGAASRGG